ncbi:MAG: PAS domain S-box protein [Spirochaetes bacterium]|nr:PAS domain S-box protein [Spirochaetota bacterium]
MRIREKLLTSILLIAIVPLLLISVSYYVVIKKVIINQVINHLDSVATVQEQRVIEIIDRNFERLDLISSRTQLRISMSEYLIEQNHKAQQKMNRILHDARASIGDFRQISVIGPDGTVAASTDGKTIGNNCAEKEYFKDGLERKTFSDFFLDINGNLRVRLSGPLFLNHSALGVVVLDIILDDIEQLSRDYTGLGETGETIIALRDSNGDALILNPLRFDQNSALKKVIHADATNQSITVALMKEERPMVNAVDYRGVPIIAVTRYIERADWGLAVEIDTEEALRPISRLSLVVGINIFVYLAIVIVLALIQSKTLTKPIITLTQAARKIGENGHARATVDVTANDEMGILYRAFNEMTRKLFQSQENLRLQIERMPIGLIMYDTDLQIHTWNPAAEKIFGFTKEEAMRKNPYELIVPPEARDHVDAITSRLIEGEMDANSTNENITKGGRRILCEWTNTPLKDGSGKVIGILAMVRDITEKHTLEKQLQQAQKLEAVGRLTGGVAHDFNNTLSAIIGYTDYILRKLDTKDENRQYLQEIKKAGERAAALTYQLLAFSRKQVLKPEVVDINGLVTDLEKMIRRIIGEDIILAVKLQTDIGRIRADPSQVEQVIMNLVINARDAMKTGGKLTIETSDVLLDRDYADHHITVQPGSYVMLAVSDDGEGIDRETQEHIFEPFFTTKENKGTGLGLATVYGIVKQSGGNIWVYSEPGRGTTFKIYLPRVDEGVVSKKEAERVMETLKGTETVLVVEDEYTVRNMISLVLKSYGYTVFEAGNGPEAIDIFNKHKEQVDLLLTDAIMPKMNGKELAERVTAINPHIKVLYSSGYTDNIIVQHGILEEGINFLQKPFAPSLLLRTVRTVLDKTD